MNASNQRKWGVLLSYLFTFINAFIGIIYIPLLITYLGQDEYGLYQLLGTFLIFLSLFDFGLSTTVTRFYSKYIAKEDFKSQENVLALSSLIYSILTIFMIVLGIIFYVNIDLIFINSLTEEEIIIAKQMFLVILGVAAIQISTSVFNSVIVAHEKFIFLRVVSILQVVFKPIVVFLVFTIEANALIVVIIQGLINVSGVLVKVWYSYSHLNVKMKLHYFDKTLIFSLVKFSSLIFLTLTMDQIFWRSGQMILGVISNTSSVAVYSIVTQIVIYYMTLSTAFSGVFLPNITKMISKSYDNVALSNIFIKIGRLQFLILGVVSSGFLIFGEQFIILWVGEEYTAAYLMTLIIIIPFSIDLIQNIGLTILQANNMYKFRAWIFTLMAIGNVILSWSLGNKFGGLGIAFSTGLFYLIFNGLVMNIYYSKKVKLNIKRFWQEIFLMMIPLSVATLMGYVINFLISDSGIVSIIIKLALYSVIYFAFMFKFAMNSYEKEMFIYFVKKMKFIHKMNYKIKCNTQK